jgi:hypothetical protein
MLVRTDVLCTVVRHGALLFGGGLLTEVRNCLHGVIPSVNADGIIRYITESDCNSLEIFHTSEETELY